MNYLTLENVTKSYGPKVLFQNISLFINKGDRIALVAKNGTGKTTLMRVLAGTEGSEGEQSKIIISKEIRTGFLMQEPDLNDDLTAIEAVFDSQNPQLQAIKNYEKALLDNDADEIQNTLEVLDELQAWDFEAKIHDIFSKLKVDTFLNQTVKTLSGGQRKRLALAKMLIDDHDFLILDEPTNDLDIVTLNVLEDFLENQYNGCLIIVTHDRYFMDKLVEHLFIFEGNGQIRDHNGNYTEYREMKKLELREQRKQANNQPVVATPSVNLASNRKMNDFERKEFKRLEKEIAQLEERKTEIETQFSSGSSMTNKDIEKLSSELQGVHKSLEIKELRWLELSEFA